MPPNGRFGNQAAAGVEAMADLLAALGFARLLTPQRICRLNSLLR